jgi:RHS repeat-associated protein
MFINGPTGRIGTYVLNQDQHLHYYVNDQIGSPRIAILAPPDTTTPHVNESILNHPFGGLAARSGNHLNNFRFTGHEYDSHSTFDFHYMVGRYYDDRVGSFTSVDKASQFASGFVYGGNNPILGRDPDGNFFMFTAPFLFGFTMSSMAAIPAVANDGDWSDWW